MNGESNEALRTAEGTYHKIPDFHFSTRAIHVGQSPDQWESGIVVPPIHLGSTFKQDGPNELKDGYEYGRSGNPSRKILESCIATLDKAKYGLTFSSGMGAVTGICALLKAGDHVICGEDVYGGTNNYFLHIGKNHGLEVDFIDTTVIEKVEAAIKPNTKMVWVESPTNPLLKITDIPQLAAAIKYKSKDIIFVVDNSFLTPYLQKPLAMGADIAMYSLSKYMNGHSDVIMGGITTNNEGLYKRLYLTQTSMGIVPSPFDCYLVNRGLKTLAVRMDRHIDNATKVAKFLEKHPMVERVMYPGLESHPQYHLAKKLWIGSSGMISMYIKGDLQTSKTFLKSLKMFCLAVSLGGYESLAQLPTLMSHDSVPAETKEQLGIADNLVRLSVGLEAVADLMNDLDQALKIAAKSS